MTAIEARTRFGELLKRVGRGEEIVITRQGKPIARVMAEGSRNLQQIRQAVAALDHLRLQIGGRAKGRAKLSDAEVRSAIEAGRR